MHSVNGSLHLCFIWQSVLQQTDLTVCAQQPPLRVIRAFHLDNGAALTHVHNLSGGVLSNDQLTLQIEVGPQAQAQLTSTGATRVYRHRAGLPDAVQFIRVRVAADGLLEYLPDALIPFAGARYHQQTSIDLDDGAGLFWWDILAPGREAHGEVFAFDRVSLAFDLTAAGRPLALERVCLEPHLRDLTSPVRFGDYRYLATFYICRVGLETDRWLALESQLSEVAVAMTHPGQVLWGVSLLPAHGLVVRALSCSGRDLPASLATFWRIARQALYGYTPTLPRKLS